MSELINEKVSVLSFYDKNRGIITPQEIVWRNRTYCITKVGNHWSVRQGRKLLHFFSVLSTNSVAFKLILDTETLHWVLEEVVDEYSL